MCCLFQDRSAWKLNGLYANSVNLSLHMRTVCHLVYFGVVGLNPVSLVCKFRNRSTLFSNNEVDGREQLRSEVDSVSVVHAQRSRCVREYDSNCFSVSASSHIVQQALRLDLVLRMFCTPLLVSPIHDTHSAQLIFDLVAVISDNKLKRCSSS